MTRLVMVGPIAKVLFSTQYRSSGDRTHKIANKFTVSGDSWQLFWITDLVEYVALSE